MYKVHRGHWKGRHYVSFNVFVPDHSTLQQEIAIILSLLENLLSFNMKILTFNLFLAAEAGGAAFRVRTSEEQLHHSRCGTMSRHRGRAEGGCGVPTSGTSSCHWEVRESSECTQQQQRDTERVRMGCPWISGTASASTASSGCCGGESRWQPCSTRLPRWLPEIPQEPVQEKEGCCITCACHHGCWGKKKQEALCSSCAVHPICVNPGPGAAWRVYESQNSDDQYGHDCRWYGPFYVFVCVLDNFEFPPELLCNDSLNTSTYMSMQRTLLQSLLLLLYRGWVRMRCKMFWSYR